MTHHRTPRHRVIAILIVGALAAAACSSGGDEVASDDGPVREAGDEIVAQTAVGASTAWSVISGAYEAFGALSECLANQEIGEPCLASESDNIRKTLVEVRELRAAIDRNQEQMLAELDSIRQLIRDQNIRSLSAQLRPMVTNVELAHKAYEALAECAVSTTGTCRPFIGRDGDPPTDTATAISKTRDYLLEKAANLPADLPVTASWFTGMNPRFDDGLAEAIWVYNKGKQDIALGVTDTAVKNARTVPVLTGTLSTETNQDLGYWADLYSQYAFFAVMYAGFTGGDRVAERRQAEADSRIGATNNRVSVLGTAAYYALPTLPATGIVLADAGKAWLVTDAPGVGRPLEPNDLIDMRRIVGTYTPWNSFIKAPRVLPPDQWYVVNTPVEKTVYPELVVLQYSMQFPAAEFTNLNVAWLADPARTTDRCPSRVRPTNTPPRLNAQAVLIPPRRLNAWGEWETIPEFTPRDRLTKTWVQLAEGRPIEYAWDSRTVRGLDTGGTFGTELGWGAWISCIDVGPGSYVQLANVPGVMTGRS